MLAIRNIPHAIYRYAAIALTAIATILIFESSRQQSLTIDEPNHIYCGTEYLQYGSYAAWPENPPLSRMFVAIGPYLNGHRIGKVNRGMKSMDDYFVASYDLDYFSKGPLKKQLFWSRLFIIPLFLASVWVVWRWSADLGGKKAGFLAVGMYSTLPAILAHSGLGTTDMCFVATFMFAVWFFARWVSHPTIMNSCWFGVTLGASLLAKYSVLGFFPPVAAVILFFFFLRGRKEGPYSVRKWFGKAVPGGLVAMAITWLLIWSFYGFSYGRLGDQPVIRAGIETQSISHKVGDLVLPAPEWFAGIQILVLHNNKGHRAYLEGTISNHGFRSYYPKSILLKTPWPSLLLLLTGLAGAWLWRKDRKSWQVIALTLVPFAIVASAMPSNINIGIRHILPVYPLGAIAGAVGTIKLLEHWSAISAVWKKWVPVLFVAWQLTIAIMAYPGFLSYLNAWGGREPGSHLSGSDMDWGQGLFDLTRFCKKYKVDTLNIAYYGLVKDCWFDLPPLKFMPDSSRPRGWVAVSENLYQGIWTGYMAPTDSCNLLTFQFKKGYRHEVHRSYRWLDKYPLVGRVGGGSIRVYYVK